MAKSNVTSINSRSKTIQGASKYTERKEMEVFGITQMRLRQLKGLGPSRYYSELIIADVFSGSGENVLANSDEPIEGSPVKIIQALDSALHNKNGFNPMGLEDKSIRLWFSDIRPAAVSHLEGILSAHKMPSGLNIKCKVVQSEASRAIEQMHEHLDRKPSARLILVVDPNGPKQFPRDEVLRLLKRHSDKVDVIPYISATAVNRCLHHRDSCDVKYDWWLSSIEGFDTGFVFAIAEKRHGWIRLPIHGDNQKWLMMPTFSPNLVPQNDWAKQGFVEINSEEGIKAISVYAGDRKAG